MIRKSLTLIGVLFNMCVFSQKEVNEKLIPFHNKEGKWGYLDADTNKVVIQAKYDFVSLFENGIAIVNKTNSNSKTLYDKNFSGLIRENGEEILPVDFIGIYDVKTHVKDSVLVDLKNITFQNGINGILKLPEVKWIIEPGKHDDFVFYNSKQFSVDRRHLYDGDKKYTAPEKHEIEYIDFKNRFFKITKGTNSYKKGISDWNGKIIVEPKYIEVKYSTKTETFIGSILLRRNNDEVKKLKNDLLDKSGKLISTFKSKYLPSFDEDAVTGTYKYKGKNFKFDLKTGKIIAESISEVSIKEIIFQDEETNLYGLKNVNGKVIINPVYEFLQLIYDNYMSAYYIAKKNINGQLLYGLLDENGAISVPFEYEDLIHENNKALIAKKNGKFGSIDFDNHLWVDFKYKKHFRINNSFAEVETDSGKGVIDFYGKIIVPTEYNSISRIPIHGKILMANLKYRDIVNYYFVVEKDNKYGLFNSHSDIIIPLEYGYIRASNDERQLANGWIITEDLERKKNGLVRIYSKVIIPPIYDSVKIFDDFLITYKKTDVKDFYQLLNLNGEPISETIYDKMDFKNGYFIISKDKREGIMNTEGKIIVPLKFNYIWAKTPNLVMIWNGERYFYINIKTGKEYILND